jgi:hypothetical protein
MDSRDSKLCKLADLIQGQTRQRLSKTHPFFTEEMLLKDSLVKIIPGKKYTKVDVGLLEST